MFGIDVRGKEAQSVCVGNGERDKGRERARETAKDNISTRREVVEFLWDTQNTQTLPY